MEMQGTRSLAITQQQAWDALNDPAILKACVPGCDRLEPAGENQYAVGMTVKIGPVSAKFSGKIVLSDIDPPKSYTIAFEGQGGAAGFGKGQSKVILVPQEGGCELQYTVNAQVGGKIAQLGQRLIDGAAKSMAEDFFKRFDAEMKKQYPDAYAAREDAQAQAKAERSFAPTVAISGGAAGTAAASTEAEDMPSTKSGVPPWVWIVGAAVVLGAIVMLM
ncbi:CoxG family protein [Variovorax sp. VNK109]|uniref:CoxG family protein n=1 Tax=Variovorax sp. VNK109 TaxID=3400919 RepID=UPI003BFDB3C7